jgi:hypothetical protein
LQNDWWQNDKTPERRSPHRPHERVYFKFQVSAFGLVCPSVVEKIFAPFAPLRETPPMQFVEIGGIRGFRFSGFKSSVSSISFWE